MTTKDHFRAVMAERRSYAPGSLDHAYRTKAARKLAWIIRGIPVAAWVA